MADTVINLTVIGDRSCSTTRTYLEHMRAAGYRPRRLWLVDFGFQSWRTRLRKVLAALTVWRHASAQNHQYAELCKRLQVQAGYTPIDHEAAWRPADHAAEVRSFCVRDFDDPLLHARMAQAADTAFLYTNGGKVPAALLDRPDIRVLHIHPGIVPDMRGSDCLLWSAAVRRRLGVSCFYMSAGIDEGALIGQREFGLPRLPALAPVLAGGEEPTAYRALLYAVDPHLRAQLLVDVLRSHPGADLRRLPARAQEPASRPAYLWMHPRLRLQVMKESFL
jgi:hypothetical protein